MRKLSKRQAEAIALMAEGMSPRYIAEKMGITEQAAKNYMSEAACRLGMRRLNRVLLAVWWNCELFQVGLRETGLIR